MLAQRPTLAVVAADLVDLAVEAVKQAGAVAAGAVAVVAARWAAHRWSDDDDDDDGPAPA